VCGGGRMILKEDEFNLRDYIRHKIHFQGWNSIHEKSNNIKLAKHYGVLIRRKVGG
jgi:hypothetical protein